MSNPKTNARLKPAIAVVIVQLQVESTYLDTVIESSLEMQSILRQRRTREPESESTLRIAPESEIDPTERQPTGQIQSEQLQSEQQQRMADRLEQLQLDIQNDFSPVIQGRRRMIEALRSINPEADKTPTLSELAVMADEPSRSTLKQLRAEIRAKLNQINSISMGNQAVLLYTLDFYNRLLAGISPDAGQSSYYNASGRSQNHTSGSIVQTKC